MTIDDLQAAFNGESNAREKYLAFAAKADQEGYAPVASLFRAAAAAEAIHAASHARVLKGMGRSVQPDIVAPHVGSTRENLQAAIQGETYERDVMYPNFIRQAKVEGNRAANTSFEFALAAEAEHAKLYQDALDHLEQWRGTKRDFYVCETCGYTSTSAPERCPACKARRERFKVVN